MIAVVTFKTNIKPLGGALDKVEKLRPVSFDWKRDDYPDHQFTSDPQVGLIAQEIREVVPEVVHEGEDEYLSVDYARLTPLLVEAFQELRAEQNAQIDRLRAEQQRQIEELRADNARKGARITELEARLARIERRFHSSQPGSGETPACPAHR